MLAESVPHSIIVNNNIYSIFVFCSCLMLAVTEGEGMLITDVSRFISVEGTSFSCLQSPPSGQHL